MTESSSDKREGLKLSVFLARNTKLSRRDAFALVREGRVNVNGKDEHEPSRPVDEKTDRVTLDGKQVRVRGLEYVMFYKPPGCVTTRETRHTSRNVYDLLPVALHHLAPVGRLDKDSEGLLLLTNDGDLAQRLMRPRLKVEKTYYVRVRGKLDPEKQKRLCRGVYIYGQKTQPAKIRILKRLPHETSLEITIYEGKKRQVRLMFATVKHKVTYLKRTRLGPLQIGAMRPGKFRPLNSREIRELTSL